MSKLNLSDLLLSDSPPPPEIVCYHLAKVFTVKSVRTNEPFFNIKFVCIDDADQVKLIVEYRYRAKTPARPDVTERWFYNILSSKDFEYE